MVITLADQGAVALERDTFYASSAFKVKVVDATGAGDVFRAGFIYGLLQKWAVPEILRFANATAGISCTRLGAIPSVPRLNEVNACSMEKRLAPFMPAEPRFTHAKAVARFDAETQKR